MMMKLKLHVNMTDRVVFLWGLQVRDAEIWGRNYVMICKRRDLGSTILAFWIFPEFQQIIQIDQKFIKTIKQKNSIIWNYEMDYKTEMSKRAGPLGSDTYWHRLYSFR